ncbi:MAG: O-antigen ligase family protein [Ignavibacteria bacterium]|nr:O-antigen ligase family protein [Ignavibacteria bacterium]
MHNLGYFDKLVYFFSISSFIISLIGLLMFFSGFFPMLTFQGLLISVTNHPNYIPPLVVIGVLSTLYIYYTKSEFNSLFSKVFLIVSSITQGFALLLSFSRTGMIALAAGLLIFLAFVYRKKMLLMLPIVVFAVPFFLVGFVKAKGFVSFISRFYLLIPAYYMLISDKTKLLWGYGVTDATKTYVQYKFEYGAFEDVNNPHNSYISYIMMYGLIFSFLFIVFIFGLLYKGIKNAIHVNDSQSKLFYGFIISVVISYLIQGLFESQMAMTDYFMMVPFLIFSGMLYFDDLTKVRYVILNRFDNKT